MRQTDLRVRLQHFDGMVGTHVRLEQMQVRMVRSLAIERKARWPDTAQIPQTDE